MGLFSAEEPKQYTIDDKQLICMFCRNNTFYVKNQQLHSRTQTIFNVEWMGNTATCFVCSGCSYMHWFMR